MATEQNKEIISRYFASMNGAEGSDMFADIDTDNFRYIIAGHSRMAGVFDDMDKLMPLFMEFSENFTSMKMNLLELIAEKDTVVAKVKGDCLLKNGKPYCNDYVFIFHLKDGKIVELTEYCDSLLIEQAVFGNKLMPAA